MRWKARSSSPARPCNGCATASASSAGRRDRRARRQGRPEPAASISCRPSSASARPTGTPKCRGAHVRPDPRHRPGRDRPRRAGKRLLPDPRPARGDARRLARRSGATPCCASTAAWSPPTGPCSASPTSSPRRSTARWSWRRPRSAPPISPASQAGVYPEPEKFADSWALDRRFKPAMSAATRERKLKGWARAVKGVLASDEGKG